MKPPAKIVEIFKNDLMKIGTKIGLEIEPVIEINKGPKFGNFSTTYALNGAKVLKKNPQEIASKITAELKKKSYYTSVEMVGAGFINIKVDPEFLSQVLVNIAREKKNYGQNKKKNYTYNLELVSANPTGWLHIGHARNAVLGDSLAKIFRFDGFDVETEYYTNDAGNQINILAVTVFVHYLNLQKIPASKPPTAYVGEIYDEVGQMMVQEYGDKFIGVKYNDNLILDPQVHQLFRHKTVTYFLKIIQQQLKDFGVEIEHYSSEQALYDAHEIEKLLTLYTQKKALYKKDGATWLKTTKFGDDKDRVIIKADGTYTYLLPDLANHHQRIQRTKADKYINIWGGDHHGYIARIRAGLALLGHPQDILDIEMVQMVRLIKAGKEYKMSKRKGTAVWLVDLIEMVGRDSLRYMLASKPPTSHFDLDLDLTQQKNSSNPVFYAQYATARCHSVLKQAQDQNIHPLVSPTSKLTNPKEIDLLVTLDNFSEVVKMSAKNRAPQVITDYIQVVAKQFHSYYGDVKIIKSSEKELSACRLGLVAAVLQVLTNAFHLIGVEVLEKM